MKTLISLSLFSVLMACGTEVRIPSSEDPTSNQAPPSSSSKDPEKSNTVLPLGLCSFETSKSRGCMKASIASTQLVIGSLDYTSGIKDFARRFTSDLVEYEYLTLEEGQNLVLMAPVTIYNFHNGFYGVVEGQGMTYSAFHTGSGNLRIDNVVPGYYGVSLFRDFDLKITNQDGKTVGYKCASIFTRREVMVEEGKESLLGQQINEFELTVYDKSCSGLGVAK